MPFVNTLTQEQPTQPTPRPTPDDKLFTPEVMQQLVAAMQQRGPPRPGGRVAQGIKAASWQGGACFECGSTSHTRKDCPIYGKLLDSNGNPPRGYTGKFERWQANTKKREAKAAAAAAAITDGPKPPVQAILDNESEGYDSEEERILDGKGCFTTGLGLWVGCGPMP